MHGICGLGIIFLIFFGGKLMKGLKITTLILTAAMLAMPLTGCNNQKKPVSSGINVISTQSQKGLEGENAGMIDPNAATNNFVFKYNGVNVVVNTKMGDIEGKFDSKSYKKTSQVSCIGAAGTDWVYTFNGGSVTIIATPAGKDYSIYQIIISDDSVATTEGVCVGNSAEQVKAAYGEPVADKSDDTVFIYEKGTSTLMFTFEENENTGKKAVATIMYQGAIA